MTLQTILNIRKNSVSIKSPLQWGLVHLCAIFHSSGSISQSTRSLELGPPGPGRGSAATHWVESPTQLHRGPRAGIRVTCCQMARAAVASLLASGTRSRSAGWFRRLRSETGNCCHRGGRATPSPMAADGAPPRAVCARLTSHEHLRELKGIFRS